MMDKNVIRQLLLNLLLFIGGVVLSFLAGYPHEMLDRYTFERCREQDPDALIGAMPPFFHVLAFGIVLSMTWFLNRKMFADKHRPVLLVLKSTLIVGFVMLGIVSGCAIRNESNWRRFQRSQKDLTNEVPRTISAPGMVEVDP